jgi:hypothetical protein
MPGGANCYGRTVDELMQEQFILLQFEVDKLTTIT